MISDVCGYLHNYFYLHDEEGKIKGFHGLIMISNGRLLSPSEFVNSLVTGSYIRIIGSRLNDGVWKHGAGDLADEMFTGYVLQMGPPAAFVKLCESIEKSAANAPVSGVASESYSNYSYTMVRNKKGVVASWPEIYSTQLSAYRKMYEEEVGELATAL